MKICLWGDIAGALKGQTNGGSELQAALLAKALVKGGHEVAVVDFDVSEDYVTDEGIKVFMIKGWNKGIRFLRIFTHRFPGLYSSLKKQNADIYYCRMRDFTHILAYWAARKVKGRFILAMASDLDALGFGMRMKYFYIPNFGGIWWLFNGIMTEIIHPYLLRKSDAVFVQHNGQKEILLRKNINSILYQNLIDLTLIPDLSDFARESFVYVGALDKRKGFAEFYELVKKSPSQKFKVIGNPRDKTGFLYYDKLKSFPNVELFGALSHSETLNQMLLSKALISTSPMEGFPNIFIEAWALGIPVLSLYFDPGGIINKEELGISANGNLSIILKEMNNLDYHSKFETRVKTYVKQNHALNEKKVLETSRLFIDLVKD
jgi:glycosyltransferase involved in cell wall biosynthesis